MADENNNQGTLIEQANAAAARLEAALKQMAELNAERVLSGRSEAGQPAPKPKEETPVEYKDRVMRGEL